MPWHWHELRNTLPPSVCWRNKLCRKPKICSHDPKPYNSFGNGSAKRVSPCGIFAVTPEEAPELARASAEVTHNHPEGIKGAQAVAAAVFLARSGSLIPINL